MSKDLMAMNQPMWEAAKKQAAMVAQVQGFGYYKRPAEAMLVAIKAHDMGLSFTEALEQVYVINGKTAIQGALMLSRIRKEGHSVKIKECLPTKATIECTRKEEKEPTTWTYTIEEARAAGLLNKDNWKKYPTDMLLWRAVARAARFQFSDCVGGSANLPDEVGVDEEREVTNFKLPEEKRSDLNDVFEVGAETQNTEVDANEVVTDDSSKS